MKFITAALFFVTAALFNLTHVEAIPHNDFSSQLSAQYCYAAACLAGLIFLIWGIAEEIKAARKEKELENG